LHCRLHWRVIFGQVSAYGQKRPLDLLDVDATVLNRLDAVGNLKELPSGFSGSAYSRPVAYFIGPVLS